MIKDDFRSAYSNYILYKLFVKRKIASFSIFLLSFSAWRNYKEKINRKGRRERKEN